MKAREGHPEKDDGGASGEGEPRCGAVDGEEEAHRPGPDEDPAERPEPQEDGPAHDAGGSPPRS